MRKGKPSQEEVIVERLQTYGQVDTFWALSHNILGLHAIMWALKQKGWDFTAVRATKKNSLLHKLRHTLLFGQTNIDNVPYYYIVTKQPR